MKARRRAAIWIAAAFCALTVALAPPLAAQSAFAVVARVNESVVTSFDVDQRRRLLTVLRTPGVTRDVALDAMIEDKLKLDAARRAGIDPTEEELNAGIESFAQRANLSGAEFTEALGEVGIAPETLQDFIRAQLAWGQLVRARFAASARPGEAEIDRAMTDGPQSASVNVQLSEIILPITPELAEDSEARAARITRMTSFAEFEAAARQFSISPSRENGGRLASVPLSELPGQVADLLLGLQPGQVTPPLPLEGAIALFQLRGLSDARPGPAQDPLVDLARVSYPAGTDLAQARANVDAQSDTCDDLYTVFDGQGRVQRSKTRRSALPQALRNVVDTMDPGEVRTLPPGAGDGGGLVMLCSRGMPPPATVEAAAEGENSPREAAAQRLFADALNGYAAAYLAELKANAFIAYP